MVVSWAALGSVAQAPKPGKLDPTRLLWLSVGLIAVLLLGALIIAIVERWRKRPLQDRPAPGDELTKYRSLYEQGVMTPEEFERIKALLGERMRQQLDLPASPSPPSPAAEPPASPEPPH